MYSRLRGNKTPLDPIIGHRVSTTTYNGKPSVVVTDTDNVILPYSIGKTMSDVVIPNFHARSKKGEIFNNPMSKTETDVVVVPFSGQVYTRVRNGYTPTGAMTSHTTVWDNVLFPDYSSVPPVDLVDLDRLTQQAINEAIASSHQRNVLGIVDIAEFGKTVELLRTNASRLHSVLTRTPLRKLGKASYRGSTKIQRYKGRTKGGVLADLAGLHLEVQYGFIPLMYTIKGLMRTLLADTKPARQTYRGSDAKHGVELSNKLSPIISPLNAGKVVGTNTKMIQYEYNAYARAGVLTDWRASLQGQLGLELRDIPSAAYELIKYSFVLDWFYDLNTMIEAAVPVKGYTALASWVTHVKEENITYQTSNTHYSDSKSSGSGSTAYSETVTGGGWTQKFIVSHRSTTRTPNISVGLPNLDLDFKSIIHAVSGLALLVSSNRKLLTSRI